MTAPPLPPPASPTLAERFRASPAVWTFALANVAAFLWVESRGGSTSTRVMVDSGALVVPQVPGEPWRLLTSTFLHFGVVHLASNLFGLAIFGPAFESLVGTRRFAALWITSGLAGSAATVLTAGDRVTVAAGASGSVFGLFGAFLFIGWRTRHTPAGSIRLRQALVLLGINLGYGLLIPRIGLEAHVGGVLAGVLVLSAYAVPRQRPGEPPPPRDPGRGMGFAVALSVAAVAASLALGPTL